MNDWYYAIGQQQQGPVTRETLLQLIRAGQVRPQDLVWNNTLTNWVPAADASGLLSEAGPAFPATPMAGPAAPAPAAAPSTWPSPTTQTTGSFNPYSSPGPSTGATTAPPIQGNQWAGHVKAVSIILIVYGGLFTLSMLACGSFFAAVATGAIPMDGADPAEDRVFGSVCAALAVVGLVMTTFIIAAGIQCLKRRGRGLGIAACIMCILTGNVIGIGAGIYGLVILCNQEAARLFERRSAQ